LTTLGAVATTGTTSWVVATTAFFIIKFTLGVLSSDQCLETKQENYDRDNEKCKDHSTHDNNPDAHALASAHENDSNISEIIIVVNTIHGDCHFHGFLRDVSWSFSNIWCQAKDSRLVDVSGWR
jgi:hypothetical protein